MPLLTCPIALDRASVRKIDQSGHLFIEKAILSASCVSPYLGNEVPEWQTLGLVADQTYQLLRDPRALAEGASSFAGKPITLFHKPISAEDHPREIVVGAVGTDVSFNEPNLTASLAIWDQEGIDGIEDDTRRDLSCGYFYQCVMDAGNYNGIPFQGRMVGITANHVSLVPDGRVEGAFVGDSNPFPQNLNRSIAPWRKLSPVKVRWRMAHCTRT